MTTINPTKISRLLANFPLAVIAQESGVPLRTLQRLKLSGAAGGFVNMTKLAIWAKTKR